MRLIQLTSWDGTPVFLRPDHVVSVSKYYAMPEEPERLNWNTVILTTGTVFTIVESIDSLRDQINEAITT